MNVFLSLQAMVKRGHLDLPAIEVAKAGGMLISSERGRETASLRNVVQNVAPRGDAEELRYHGAHLVVNDLGELVD